jgi:EAL domain-containing protein (putative c-di-GMP-specific phosphodiesterase class I)/ActR/RegA family two-component response regulator
MLNTAKPQVTVNQEGANKPIAYVLDDEGPVGTLVSRMLSSLGYVPLTFTQVPQCLQQLKESPEYSKPSLLVLDLALGKHDAVDVFDQLKALDFKGRLLLMSGVDETTLNDVQKICTSKGLTAFAPLKKPFRIDALKERLASKTVAPEADEVSVKGPAVSVERALAGGTLALWYENKVELKSGSVCGAEALLFGQHPAYGFVPLADSLPPPESPLYLPLARTVTQQVKADWIRCFANDKAPLHFSTRLPLAVIMSRGFVALLRETISADARFPGLTLDVTDAHQIRNTPGLWEVAAQLKLHRVTLSLTDIGAAYVAITRNHKFPFVEIKLDAELVTNCLLHKSKLSVCQGIIDLAHSADALACAEGVANLDQLQALVAMGCDRAQGPFFGKPQPIDGFRASLRPTGAATQTVLGTSDPYAWPADTAA